MSPDTNSYRESFLEVRQPDLNRFEAVIGFDETTDRLYNVMRLMITYDFNSLPSAFSLPLVSLGIVGVY